MNLLIDNSAISLLSCRRKFQLTVIDGLTGFGNASAEMGSAIHTVIELLDKNSHTLNQAIDYAIELYPGADKLKLISATTLFHQVVKQVPAILINGAPAIEFKFKHRYGSFITPTGTKIDIDLTGTIDKIYIDPVDELLTFRDYKSAADVKDYSIKNKMDDYDLSFQLPFYAYNMFISGILPAEYMELIRQHRYKCEYFFVFYNNSPPVFKRRQYGAFTDNFLLEEVPYIIHNKISTIIDIVGYKNDPAPHDGMTTYKACTYCPFRVACLSMGTEKELEYLSRFDRKEYNPLTFR